MANLWEKSVRVEAVRFGHDERFFVTNLFFILSFEIVLNVSLF